MTPLIAIPLFSLALLVAGAVVVARRLRGREGRLGEQLARSIAWLVVPVAALLAACYWCATGLYLGSSRGLIVLSAASLVAGAVSLSRGRVMEWVDALGRRSPEAAGPVRALMALVAVLACTVLGFLAMELPYNVGTLSVALGFAAIEMSLILGALLVLFFLFQRHGAGLALGVGLCWVIGLAQYFIANFKASAILPNDLFVLQTAAAVSGSYVYSVNGMVLTGLCCVVIASAICSLVAATRAETSQSLVRRTVVNLACALAALTALWAGVTIPNYFDDLGVGMEYWYSLDYYKRQGFLTTFVAVAQDLPIEVPEGYTDAAAAETEASYVAAYDEGAGAEAGRTAAEEQFEELRPTVICIMNETFSDISVFDGESWGYAGPERFNSRDDAILGGGVSVSVLGGGTCNSEFEFLTGVPLAYVGDGKYPYSLYDLSSAPSLARQFSELGYKTTALHPNYATNWNRDRVYSMLGFDEFLSIEDFEGSEWFHSGVSDAETYDKVLELLEQSDEPQFVFDVTMQNHSPYDQCNLGEVPQYSVEGLSPYDNMRVSEYLACIEESDRALDEFLAELEQLDRPVVVLFFGDHQPALSSILNNTIYAGEQTLEHSQRTHETRYLVWANYDVAGSTDGEKCDTSVCYLAALLAEKIGLPLTDYQKTQLVAREELPSISLIATRLADGSALPAGTDASSLPASYLDLSYVTYLEFASKLK